MYFCISLKKFILCIVVVLAAAAAGIAAASEGFEHAAAVSAAQFAQPVQSDEKIFVPVLMYHSLLKDPSGAGDYVLSPDVFIGDMEYLSQNGFTTVFVSDLVSYVEDGVPLPEKPVIVTFDDGYYNVMEYAYISRSDPDCLLCINRYNRPSGISTDEFMEKVLEH